MLDSIYYCFRILPYGLPHLQAVKKERKLYLWDWSLCQNDAAQFETLVPSHLLKYCHFHEDTEGDDRSLRFLRDSAGRAIDFVVRKNGKLEFAVECKSGDRALSKNITYFSRRAPIPKFYQVHLCSSGEDSEWLEANARILPFTRLCEILRI